MSNFNQLYNLILESIITLNKASRKAMLLKSLNNSAAIIPWLDWLDYFDNKTADFLCKYIADGTIIEGLDKRIDIVVQILKLNPSIDTQNYKGTLDLFINQYKESVNKHLLKQAAKTVSYLDSIPQFSLKQVCLNGVVVYKVLDSKNGMKAVRKIVDKQLGSDANPWCLISRYPDEEPMSLNRAWLFWKRYNDYPKHIAFQNGKVLAFCASRNLDIAWWDRYDELHDLLIDFDGNIIDTKKILFYDTKLLDLLDRKWFALDFIYNKETGRYDTDLNLYIKPDNIDEEGKISIPLGVIKGDFECENLPELRSLENFPTRVEGTLRLAQCPNITSLKGITQDVGKIFDVSRNNQLFSLKGCPKETKSHFECVNCYNLMSLLGAPQKVNGDFNCASCKHLPSLEGGPVWVAGDYRACYLDGISNLEGAPKYVGGDFIVNQNYNLKSLKGSPLKVGKMYECYGNCELLNLDYITKDVGNYYSINENDKIDDDAGLKLNKLLYRKKLVYNKETKRWDVKGSIKIRQQHLLGGQLKIPIGVVEGDFRLNSLHDLTSLYNGPTLVKGSFTCSSCEHLHSLKFAPKKVGGNFYCDGCDLLENLEGAPKYVGGDFNCSLCYNLTSLKGAPKYVGGKFECGTCVHLTDKELLKNITIKGLIDLE